MSVLEQFRNLYDNNQLLWAIGAAMGGMGEVMLGAPLTAEVRDGRPVGMPAAVALLEFAHVQLDQPGETPATPTLVPTIAASPRSEFEPTESQSVGVQMGIAWYDRRPRARR